MFKENRFNENRFMENGFKENGFKKNGFMENTNDMNFPVLTPAVINVSNMDFKKVKEKKKNINKNTKNIREGWVKLYYENGKIVKKYGLVRKDPPPHPPYPKSLEEKFSETIVKMRENWELYNEVHGYEVDYDYYNDQNEYESDTELNNQEYDDLMNEELIDSMYTRDD